MKKIWILGIILFLMGVSVILTGSMGVAAPGPNVVSQYGELKVERGQLCDHNGKPIQLKGMSTLGLWSPYNAETVKNLVQDWHISVLRVAMYTKEYGYIDNPSVKEKVKMLVNAAIDQGIYVIIDWHILSDGDPNQYKEQAKAFFVEMAKMYGQYPNVIYEICNEPNGEIVGWDNRIKPYAEYMIPAIRAVDPDNIIVVGTDTWSQGVRAAADNPLQYSNIMYALHFYAGTHGRSLRNNADYALSKGIAIFVTEWGVSTSTGGGGVFLEASQQWLDWMDTHKLSWVNWSMSDRGESSAALLPGTGVTGPWKDSVLSESGKWVKAKILMND
jgi:endoglucanase